MGADYHLRKIFRRCALPTVDAKPVVGNSLSSTGLQDARSRGPAVEVETAHARETPLRVAGDLEQRSAPEARSQGEGVGGTWCLPDVSPHPTHSPFSLEGRAGGGCSALFVLQGGWQRRWSLSRGVEE